MTLYEEVYYNTPNLTKFYRYEGFGSRSYFQFQEENYLTTAIKYIYFSKNERHHTYYVERRLKQLISEEVLKETGIKFNKENIIDNGSFNEIERYIENHSFDNKSLSIEFCSSPIMSKLLSKNTISNRNKLAEDRRIERVDSNLNGGGYGFCEDWLYVFEILTHFYTYRRITTEDMLNFLYMYRRNIMERKHIFNTTSFLLDPKTRVIKINNKIYSDFTKYELMNALQRIVEEQLYFKESIFKTNPNDTIKKIIQEYIKERETILQLSESIYNKNIRTLNRK